MKGLLLGGLAAGIFDSSYAFTRWGLRGVSPKQILHKVASGLLGPEAFKGGATTAVLGMFLHFTIAFLASTGFYFLYRLFTLVRRWPLLAGALYGGFFYFLMIDLVVPLSRTKAGAFAWIDLLGHIVLIGMPIGFLVSRYSAPKWVPSAVLK